LAGMLVALPSTIAYGILAYSALGPQFAMNAALGAVLGAISFNLVSAAVGGAQRLISSPSAPTAAVISVFVTEMVHRGGVAPEIIPLYVSLLTAFAGLLQLVFGSIGGGKFVKYIPYPVIAGYLLGVSFLIIIGQIPRIFGLPKGMKWSEGLMLPALWNWQSICIAIVTMAAVYFSKKYIKQIPSVVTALMAGVIAYFILALFNPPMLHLSGNSLVVGRLIESPDDIPRLVINRWSMLPGLNFSYFQDILVPGLTLALLLSVTTLNTCVVLDTMTFSSHNPRRTLIGQGLASIASGFMCGIPGAGLMGATVENVHNGGKTSYSAAVASLTTLTVLLVAGRLLAWLPVAALAGILVMVASRSIDLKLVNMLKNKSTIFDFVVILTVVIAAVNLDLIKGAGVGLAMAILLFLREQMNVSVIRRRLFGNQVYSKKIRLKYERAILDENGDMTLIIELQGQLFFGTTDQLNTTLESYYPTCKFFILDMRRIQSVDYTAANMLKKILTRVKQKKGYLIFTNIPTILPTGQNIKQYFKNLGLNESPGLRYYDSTEDALEWVEDEILIEKQKDREKDRHILRLQEIELVKDFPEDALQKLGSSLVEKVFHPGELIFKAGDESDEIYFVRQGAVKITLPISDGKVFHLLTIGAGGIFGEMAFIDNVRRSADAVPLDECYLYVLSRSKFEEVTAIYPDIAGKFYHRLALLTVNRLRQSNKELKVFQEN